MDEHSDSNPGKKGLNIQHGYELEASPESGTSPEGVDAVVPKMSRLSVNINTSSQIVGSEKEDGGDCKESEDIIRQMYITNKSFYSDYSPRRKKRQEKLDVNLVRLKPQINMNYVNGNYSKRSVNENLNSYMVVRQRMFHGFPRTRREMKTLPLTDPRDVTCNWLHRSKTDLYIEKRREKNNIQHQKRSKSQTDLHGMTFGNLVEHLPRTKSSSHYVTPRQRFHGNHSARSCPDFNSDKLPPLTLNRMKQLLQNDIDAIDSNQYTCSPYSESSPQNLAKRKVRKNFNTTCMPLKVWEPSLDCIFYSRQKELTPRNIANSTQQQSSSLK